MTNFSYSNLSYNGICPTEPWQVYLHIVADFEVNVDGCLLYAEQLFPVVEFVIEAQVWARGLPGKVTDFIFASMESEQEALIWIRSCDEAWRIGSTMEGTSSGPLQVTEAVGALNDLYHRLRADVAGTLHTDIEDLFAWEGRP